jgi:hypothetical protein
MIRTSMILFKQNLLILSSLLLFLITASNIQSQTSKTINKKQKPDIYEYAMEKYGTDDELINGLIYLPQNPNAKGNQFFVSDDYLKGKIYKQGVLFDDQLLKYDIENDELVLHGKVNKSYIDILLHKSHIDSFLIADRFFINSTHLFSIDTLNKFFELIYRNNSSFLIEYYKEFRTDYNEKTPHGRYTSAKKRYFIFENNELFEVTRKSKFLRFFRQDKRDIRKFMKKNKIRYKKAQQTELKRLMEYCNGISK